VNPSSDRKTVVVSFYGMDSSSSNNGGGNTPCLRTEQGDNFRDPVVVGGTAEHTLYLINNTNFNITVTRAQISGGDSNVFAITSTFPITVPAHTNHTTLTYTFSPISSTREAYKSQVILGLQGDSLQCERVSGVFIGFTTHSITTVDTVVRPLFPNEKRTLGLEGNGATVTTTFYFTNNLNVDCTVNRIYLADGTFFSISSYNPTPTPFVLHPNDQLTVVITYTATDHFVHHDSLIIDANHQLLSQSFELQGVLTPSSGVSNMMPTDVAISISPNPVSNYLTVDMAGVRFADIQIINMLGEVITTSAANTTWKWNASNISQGSYIVRVAGESITGEKFVASKRIVVTK
jgi:hypothetical protein